MKRQPKTLDQRIAQCERLVERAYTTRRDFKSDKRYILLERLDDVWYYLRLERGDFDDKSDDFPCLCHGPKCTC